MVEWEGVSVPAATTTSIVIYNTLVSPSSTIIVTPVGIAAFGGGITITSQGAGTFTVTSKNPMGTGGGGMLTALNYIVVNHLTLVSLTPCSKYEKMWLDFRLGVCELLERTLNYFKKAVADEDA